MNAERSRILATSKTINHQTTSRRTDATCKANRHKSNRRSGEQQLVALPYPRLDTDRIGVSCRHCTSSPVSITAQSPERSLPPVSSIGAPAQNYSLLTLVQLALNSRRNAVSSVKHILCDDPPLSVATRSLAFHVVSQYAPRPAGRR